MKRTWLRFLAVLAVPGFLMAAVPADLVVPLTTEDLVAIESSGERRYLVGVTKPSDAALDLSSLRPEDLGPSPRALPLGQITRTESGFTWRASIEAPGAVALRLHFTNLFLPRNATLTLAGADGASFSYADRGPASTGEFWSHTVTGDRAELRVDYAGNDLGRVLQALRFMIAEVGPLGSRFPVADPQAGDELCSFNEPCVLNADCVTLPSAVQDAQAAAAMILFVSGPYQYICSGGLIADSDSGSQIPYFLTANHCLSKGSEASSLEAYFDYKTACGTCDTSISDEPRVLGSSIAATNRTSDYTLLRLSQNAPAGAAFLRWNSTAVANSNGVSLYRISHPAGAPQAYSSQRVDTSKPTCRSWPRGSWIYSIDVEGATEGGSSGSPVVNGAGEVVGQLSGACGYNVNDPCDEINNATVDGAFAAYYSEVASILGPGGSTCTDADGDGYCASEGDCDDSNPNVNPGAAEVCGDGLDNDCDGQTDSSDSDCQTGGCDLVPSGGPCTENGECCSGNCKGRPGSRTCK